MTTDPLGRAARLVAGARRIVALTGAGISTESGVPDFRGAAGMWSRYDPEMFSYPNYVRDADARRAYWRWSREFWPTVEAARPNAAHAALAALERAGRLRCVVTQNVDGLHAAAGSRDVVEIHGNGTRVRCLSCGEERPRGEIQARLALGEDDPRCASCGGILKTCAVLFGEPMPAGPTSRAFDEASSCDLLLAVGSSLVVNPAARLVPTAKQAGAAVVIVNLERTVYDPIADVTVRGTAGDALAAIVCAALPESPRR